MADDTSSGSLSPTVQKVVETTFAALRTYEKIPKDAINRLEALLRKGAVPKPDIIIMTLFDPPVPK